MKRFVIAIVAALGVITTASAIDRGPAFDDPDLQARYQRLISEIRCVTCQNMTIKDSNVFLAADLRREVRERIEAGYSDSEIFEFLTARYGDFVLYKTPFNARTWAVYAAPPLFLLLGAYIAWRTVRRRMALPLDDSE
ncbi:MAG: cytochrome c-type biogenesis protein [Pseudomonadota bacterium]